ncbi:hypothetical protein [Marinicella meishanensis]|uniref:hypothetical protein n=1 Tax=Marinicella meishanensis TaxID=2873263 RepID=UPI001CBB7AAB|nr:hypothetical protein [Marinicella sp. NBU2979]
MRREEIRCAKINRDTVLRKIRKSLFFGCFAHFFQEKWRGCVLLGRVLHQQTGHAGWSDLNHFGETMGFCDELKELM